MSGACARRARRLTRPDHAEPRDQRPPGRSRSTSGCSPCRSTPFSGGCPPSTATTAGAPRAGPVAAATTSGTPLPTSDDLDRCRPGGALARGLNLVVLRTRRVPDTARLLGDGPGASATCSARSAAAVGLVQDATGSWTAPLVMQLAFARAPARVRCLQRLGPDARVADVPSPVSRG